MRLVGGLANLGQALAHRLTTERGNLFYDQNYGTDTRDWLNETIDAIFLARARVQVQQECQKDERVQNVTCYISYDQSTATLTILVNGYTAIGPFSFVFSVTSTDISVISANSQAV